MKIRKHQGGAGIMPLIYTPLQSPSTGAATTAAPATSSQKQNILNDSTIKDLYSKALPSDLEAFVNKSNIFGNSLFTSGAGFEHTERDLKSLILYMNKMAFEKDTYSEAMKRIDKIEGSSEIAISPNNGIFVIRDKKLKEIAYTDIKEGEYALTNAQLAQIRAHNSGAAFDTNMTQALTNATSMKEIHSVIDRSLSGLGYDKSGNTEFGLFDGTEDITLEDLRTMNYSELIKQKTKIGSNKRQIEHVINSIYKQLTPAQRTLLGYRAQEIGSKDIPSLIFEYIVSRSKNEYSISEDLNKAGKGSSKSGSGESEKLEKMSPMEIYQSGAIKNPRQITLSPGNSAAMVLEANDYGQAVDNEGNPIGNSSLEVFRNKGFGTIGRMDQGVYMGNQKITPDKYGEVMYNGSSLYRAWLPYAIDQDGTIKPNFELIEEFIKLDKLIRANPENRKQIIQDSIFKDYVTENGEWNTNKMMPFYMVNAYATGEDPWYGDYKGAINPDNTNGYFKELDGQNKDVVTKILKKILGTKEYPYSAYDSVYEGVVFIPAQAQTALGSIASNNPIYNNKEYHTAEHMNNIIRQNTIQSNFVNNSDKLNE